MQKSSRIVGLFLLLFGFMFLTSWLGHPRIKMLHGVDIVGLTGGGACLGVGFVGLMGRLRLPEK